MFYLCTQSGNGSVFVYRQADFSLRMGQFSNSVAAHPHTNEVEVTPLDFYVQEECAAARLAIHLKQELVSAHD